MRAIEFRFYNPFNETMVYNYQFQMLSDFFIEHDKILYHESNPPVLMQYTGLQDAKGNKIFEGDIVRGAWSENLKPMVVEFQPPSFIMRISKKQWSEFIIFHEENQTYVVIGNKYQHGELLNEQKTANIGTDRDG